jgi:non-ribosomal peptide synthetase component F
MMAIEMVGGVYCPLSPRDPQQRLHALMQQTQSHLVLVHHLTKNIFADDIVLFDFDSLLTSKYVESDINFGRLPNLSVTFKNIAYIIFTSGSTGTPKPVSNEIKPRIKRLIYLFPLSTGSNSTQELHSIHTFFDSHGYI